MNPSVCPPYNADFDGDEMNLHVLQTEEARVEASSLMEVQKNIISPKFGGPIIGLDLDQISGMFLLTGNNIVMTREEASQLLASAGIDIDLPDGKTFTGKELFSLLLPKGLNLEFKASCCRNCDECRKDNCPYDGWVSIVNGEVKKGRIDKAAVGAGKGRIINKIVRLSGPEEIRNFIDYAGRLGIAFLMRRGFSIGIADLDLSPEDMKKVTGEIDTSERDANQLVDDYHSGELKILPGMTAEESMEAQILNTLASGVSRISDIVAEKVKHSDIQVMSNSGAKGSIINTTQMAAVVGQETILGERIKRGYLDRTLPHIRPHDLSPASHGFVRSSFKAGLQPFGLFWNIMNGREGLMDKSLRTRKSGYMQRRLVNALQDMKVFDDGSVRNANHEIVQFLAGEDGVDPSKSEWGALRWRDHVQGVM
jgi:DNA-directed RNA polymerase subunit A'